MKKRNDFQDFVKYVSLNVLGMIGLSCYILADTYFVSKGLGANGLAALNLAIPVYSFIHGSGLMIGMGGGTKYSIQKSRKDSAMANRTFTHCLALAALLAAVFMLAGIFFSGPIISFLGADETVFSMSRTYLQVILLFAPAFLLNNVLLCFIRNDGAPQLSMGAMLLGSLSNIILDWVFIFPCRMGIFGAAFATGLAPVISISLLSSYFFKKKNKFHLSKWAADARLAAGILSGGVPSLVTEVSSGVVMIVFNFIILNLEGNTGVAAYGIIANLSLVVIAVYTGIAQGIQPLISRNYGAGNRKNVTSVLKYALVLMTVLSIMIYGTVYFGAPQIAHIFNSEQNALLQSIAVLGLRLYFIACPFAGFNVILSIYFTSCEKPLPAHILSLLRGFFVIIPMTFVLSSLAGIEGVWCAFWATEILVAGIGLILLIRLIRKNKSLYSR